MADYFYCPEMNLHSREVQLSPEESHHLGHVVRKPVGDIIGITNGRGTIARAEIVAYQQKRAVCKIRGIQQTPPPPAARIHLGMAIIRTNRFNWAVEKLTELGVGSITPLICQHNNIRTCRTDHLTKVAIAALKQSRQSYLPVIQQLQPFSRWLHNQKTKMNAGKYLAHLSPDSQTLSGEPFSPEMEIVVGIGPEGGFSEEEAHRAGAAGFTLWRLDDHVLRAETAAIVAVAQLKLYLVG